MSEDSLPGPLTSVCEHLDSHGIRYQVTENRIHFGMDSGNAIQRCTFRLSPDGQVLQIHVGYPVAIPEKRRPSVAELLTRANYGLVLGNFEMDFSDGEVRFHVSHILETGALEDSLIRRLFSTALLMADRYFPALMQHLHGGLTPEDAVYMAELDSQLDLAETTSGASQPPAEPPRPEGKPPTDEGSGKAPKPAGKPPRRKRRKSGE